MTKVRYVEAKYDTTISWDIEMIAEEFGYELEDIGKVEVGKWIELRIHLKNGTTISKQITPELDNTDWKWSSMDSYLDENWNPIDEDELFPDTYTEEVVNET